MEQLKITDDLEKLMAVLPPRIVEAVTAADNFNNLLEIIMDLGRLPTARFVNREIVLSQLEITRADLDLVVENIGEFDADNRAGMERTLHRISALRNRHGTIVGLTCRVGRAVYGTLDIIQDLVESGKSILILGQPGIGKTTMLREAARILAENKRVIIVDTSNEIGGDGDVPHPAVGRARRMQVATPALQHEVMIEAVENHNPEVIVIDEIGREMEAIAARTIAERGVQLIGTAHGRSIENLLINPTLSDLIGGIEAVTLSDEEARRRGTQKTVLERRSPPTFDVLIEIKERNYLVVHPDVTEAVDALVRGFPMATEVRERTASGEIRIEKSKTPAHTKDTPSSGLRRPVENGRGVLQNGTLEAVADTPRKRAPMLKPVRLYAYGVARNRLEQAAKRLGVPVVPVKDIREADVLITLRTYYRNRQRTIIDAEESGMPIYVLRSNTTTQMEQALAEIFSLASETGVGGQPQEVLIRETQSAIEAVLNGQRWVDLPPAAASIRHIQHEMARQANLVSHSYGKEPGRRVRIYRD